MLENSWSWNHNPFIILHIPRSAPLLGYNHDRPASCVTISTIVMFTFKCWVLGFAFFSLFLKGGRGAIKKQGCWLSTWCWVMPHHNVCVCMLGYGSCCPFTLSLLVCGCDHTYTYTLKCLCISYIHISLIYFWPKCYSSSFSTAVSLEFYFVFSYGIHVLHFSYCLLFLLLFTSIYLNCY